MIKKSRKPTHQPERRKVTTARKVKVEPKVPVEPVEDIRQMHQRIEGEAGGK